MRSDFWSLPYAARFAIQSGERAQHAAEQRAWTISELRQRVAELEKALAVATAEIAALNLTKGSDQ